MSRPIRILSPEVAERAAGPCGLFFCAAYLNRFGVQ